MRVFCLTSTMADFIFPNSAHYYMMSVPMKYARYSYCFVLRILSARRDGRWSCFYFPIFYRQQQSCLRWLLFCGPYLHPSFNMKKDSPCLGGLSHFAFLFHCVLFSFFVPQMSDDPLDETEISIICRDILNGLAYLHDRDIIHRDIKGARLSITSISTLLLLFPRLLGGSFCSDFLAKNRRKSACQMRYFHFLRKEINSLF